MCPFPIFPSQRDAFQTGLLAASSVDMFFDIWIPNCMFRDAIVKRGMHLRSNCRVNVTCLYMLVPWTGLSMAEARILYGYESLRRFALIHLHYITCLGTFLNTYGNFHRLITKLAKFRKEKTQKHREIKVIPPANQKYLLGVTCHQVCAHATLQASNKYIISIHIIPPVLIKKNNSKPSTKKRNKCVCLGEALCFANQSFSWLASARRRLRFECLVIVDGAAQSRSLRLYLGVCPRDPWSVTSSIFRQFPEWTPFQLPSPKLTASSHLKMDGWNISFLLGRPIFSGYVVSFRECNITREPTGHTWTPNENRSTYAQSSHIYRVPTIPTEGAHHEQALEMHLSVSNGAKWYGPNIGDLTVVATSNKIG